MRENHDFGIVQKGLLHINHIVGHDRANRPAGREEKIGDVNFALVIFLGNSLAVLIDKRKISDRMVFRHVLHGAVDEFGIHVRWVVNRQRFFGFERRVKQPDANHRKDTHNPEKDPEFLQKIEHNPNL